MKLDEEINECLISNNYSIRLFTKLEVEQFKLSISDDYGMASKGTNVMLRHVIIKNSISKVQLIDMSNEDMKLFLEMIKD